MKSDWINYQLKNMLKMFFMVFYIFPIKRNRIVFCAYSGKKYACNPKYICEQIVKDYPFQFEIIWVMNKYNPELNQYIQVKRNSVRYIYYILTAKVIIGNGGFNAFLPYRKNQLKINTWHGGGAYKKCGLDCMHSFVEGKRLKKDGANTDILISSCKLFSQVFPSSCGILPNKVWEIGMPRNDVFFHSHEKRDLQIRQMIGIREDQKLLLYAPTYRGDFKNALFKDIAFDTKQCLSALKKRFGGEWILGFRMHYAYDSDIKEIENAINLSFYPDMQELLLAADVLITDYSSSIWDFSFTGKPCFIFANDLEEYKSEVDFYTPLEQWPFSIAKNDAQLANNILNFNEDEYKKAIEQHHRDLGNCETGNASKTVANAIYEYCFQGKTKADIMNCNAR